MLSAIAHAGGPKELAVAEAAVGAIASVVDEDRKRQYLFTVFRAVSAATGRRLEATIASIPRSP